jgi:hypothetical protein
MSTIAPEGKEMKNRLVLYKNPLYCQENIGLWNGHEKVTFGGVPFISFHSCLFSANKRVSPGAERFKLF